jgi:class 3 adenylate cyclase
MVSLAGIVVPSWPDPGSRPGLTPVEVRLTLGSLDVEIQRKLDAATRFPERNPNPVLRIDATDHLIYANPASARLVAGLGLDVGHRLPTDLSERLREAESAGSDEPVEVQGGSRWYELTCVPIPELGFSHIYGRDVTAQKALDRFPGQNPNPVLRVSRDGVLLFANAASDDIVRGLGLALGERVPRSFRGRLAGRPDEHGEVVFEVEVAGRTYRLVAVSGFEFDFTNVYGTDITAARQLEVAHRENERLLLNILPAPIAARLRAGERIIADRHEDLSLLFADIVDFTRMSGTLSPVEVVDLLDGLFRSLDDLTDHYRLEKIKTIGDAYMVVGGLPPDVDDHLARTASMALDLVETLRASRSGNPVSMRIGLHAGPAVAGVIGARKFIYDVWGGTVNMASRLESYGAPSRIQVSDAVRERLEGRFDFESRGVLDLKGVGPTRTWFLRGHAGAGAGP